MVLTSVCADCKATKSSQLPARRLTHSPGVKEPNDMKRLLFANKHSQRAARPLYPTTEMAALHNPLDKKTQHIMCDIDAVFQAVSSWAAELTAQVGCRTQMPRTCRNQACQLPHNTSGTMFDFIIPL
jgi:hypothetical protein